MRNDAEIGVVGAGPAGARTAELLAKQGIDHMRLEASAEVFVDVPSDVPLYVIARIELSTDKAHPTRPATTSPR